MRALGLILFLALAACGPAPRQEQDAGIDTSCGLDCAAQQHYGLLVNRCFEYSTTAFAQNPAALGVVVRPVEQLEGGLPVLPLEYRESGQTKMTDYFTLRDGSLLLARRTWLPGQSVTYRDAEDGPISGVTWLSPSAAVGETYSSSTWATVAGAGNLISEATTYRVVLAAASTSERTVPLSTYPEALQMLLSETPDHGVDPRRVFVDGTGFVFFTSSFSPLASVTASPYYLQKIRDLGTPDAGPEDCGFGAP